MCLSRLLVYTTVVAMCASCEYISEVASGGGQQGVDSAKEDSEISLADINEVLEAIQGPEELTSSEPEGTLQGTTHAEAVDNIAEIINARPEILKIVDDWGNTCSMQNSEFCGGYGVALVPAHDDEITGLACGPGTAVGQMVVNYEWVPC